jgi:nitric oxide reductase NorQ protein
MNENGLTNENGLRMTGSNGDGSREDAVRAMQPEAGDGFVSTSYVEELTARALTYLEVGYPLHFAGPAGTGKTTLAFHVAANLGRPVILVHGDDEFGSSDLIGRDIGYRKSKLIDNFIHSVLKAEENMSAVWMDNRLTTACRHGYTLIYDEFNRSRPEANNVLLSVLEERVLPVPGRSRSEGGYLEVHANFRAIFTSNPEEYSGVHKTQDALMDRLITIQLGHYDRASEISITARRTAIAIEDAERIVDIVRAVRGLGVNNHRPTIRASIAIGAIVAHRRLPVDPGNAMFINVCQDVLSVDSAKITHGGEPLVPRRIEEIVRKTCAQGNKHAGPRVEQHKKRAKS